eukprot:COSAG05_NODE_1971_length_3766_cov_556.224434_2_plen_74_part_00
MHDARVLYMYLASPRRFAQISGLKSQVSSLKSQVPLDCPSLKSQVSSICLFFFIFFSFHDKYSCVYSSMVVWH